MPNIPNDGRAGVLSPSWARSLTPIRQAGLIEQKEHDAL